MIGVFDSGYGGLTVLRRLLSDLPQYEYTYIADNANAPYGDKSHAELIEHTWRGVEALFDRGSTLVILACNTASTALRHIQQELLPKQFPERRVLGVIVPTVEHITGADWRHEQPITTPMTASALTVGVIATPATVASGVYAEEIRARNTSLRVVEQACPTLVPLIEAGAPSSEITAALQGYIDELSGKAATELVAVLLGCTHYELIASEIAAVLPEQTNLYRQPTVVAKSLASYLDRHPELVPKKKDASRTLLTTGDAQEVSARATRYFGELDAPFEHITLTRD